MAPGAASARRTGRTLPDAALGAVLRRWMPVLAALAAAAAAPATAQAHVHSGVVATPYRASVSVQPAGARAAVAVRVDASDRALRVEARPGHTVLVLDSGGEPLVRLGPARRSATWHDPRLRAPAAGVERRRWAIGLIVDGRRARLTGAVVRVPAPPIWPWLLLAAPFVLAAALVLRNGDTRTHERAAAALGAVAGAATIVAALDFALDRYASAGTWVESANELVFTVVGLLVLAFGGRSARLAAGGALGTLGVFVGLTKFASLLDGVVLSALPVTATRAAVVLALAAGAAALTIAARCLIGGSAPAAVGRAPDSFWES